MQGWPTQRGQTDKTKETMVKTFLPCLETLTLMKGVKFATMIQLTGFKDSLALLTQGRGHGEAAEAPLLSSLTLRVDPAGSSLVTWLKQLGTQDGAPSTLSYSEINNPSPHAHHPLLSSIVSSLTTIKTLAVETFAPPSTRVSILRTTAKACPWSSWVDWRRHVRTWTPFTSVKWHSSSLYYTAMRWTRRSRNGGKHVHL